MKTTLSYKKFSELVQKYGYSVEINYTRDRLIGFYPSRGRNMPISIRPVKLSVSFISKHFYENI